MKKKQKSYVQRWENNAKPEDQDPTTRVTGMLEKPKVTDANQKSKVYVDINAISGEANEDTYEEGLKIWVVRRRGEGF